MEEDKQSQLNRWGEKGHLTPKDLTCLTFPLFSRKVLKTGEMLNMLNMLNRWVEMGPLDPKYLTFNLYPV